ncbi:hypothetical protein [Brasilonema sp. UFV-L1]|uniref:hypothetical protein n=1 Tax=Brasilonema sp. UFV-L1 TaxID=2234130 RepID=UPI00145F309A|nr:hypothetical protein [Brasilonema sp. UFV-L1]NMG07689.1 hypothetical protein [Brasilonema sp. UFV-L1]
MSILKRLPFFSLGLLLITYTTTGWVISTTYTTWYVWLLTAIAILFLIGGITTSLTRVADYSFILFKSNLKSFGLTVLAAFLFFLMTAKFRLFLDTLLIVAAVVLARIDFQAAGFSKEQAFWLLSIFSLAGFALGVLIRKFI